MVRRPTLWLAIGAVCIAACADFWGFRDLTGADGGADEGDGSGSGSGSGSRADSGSDFGDASPDSSGSDTGGEGSCAETCSGCCDGTLCVTATSATQCGQLGSSCQNCMSNEACVADSCNLGLCVHTPSTGNSCGSPGNVCFDGGCWPCGGNAQLCCQGDTCVDPAIIKCVAGSTGTLGDAGNVVGNWCVCDPGKC